MLEISSIFNQFILVFGQAMYSCLYIRHFNVLMFSLGNKNGAESLLKDNDLAFTEAENTRPKYEESLRSKNLSK